MPKSIYMKQFGLSPNEAFEYKSKPHNPKWHSPSSSKCRCLGISEGNQQPFSFSLVSGMTSKNEKRIDILSLLMLED